MLDVEVFITEQPHNFQPIYKKLRFLITSQIPQIEEKMAYGIPFFYLKRRIFYLSPKKKDVELGFCDGYLLSDNPVLDVKGRSQVRTIFFSSHKEVDENIIIPLIHEAVIVQKQKKRSDK